MTDGRPDEDALAKDRERWSLGDYPALGDRWASVGQAVAAELDDLLVLDGRRLTDVACGHGTTAIAAARRGAVVTGIDLTPALLNVARDRAREADVRLALVEGDFHDLPAEDDSAEVVTSTFGVNLAAAPAVAAAELARIVRPGGLVALAAWTRGGAWDDRLDVVGELVPTALDGLGDAPDWQAWSEADGVTELIAGTGLVIDDLATDQVVLAFADGEAALREVERTSGSTDLLRRAVIDAGGDWDAVRAGVAARWQDRFVDGGLPLGWARVLLRLDA